LEKHTSGGLGDSPMPGSGSDGAAAAAQLNAGTPGATDTASPTLKVTAAVESPAFAQGLAERVSWMAGNNLNGARLQVNPAQLGPIEVRIAVQGDHAQVWLTSHSAVTRDALESSSPKLREMLGAQGFGQVSVDISQRSFQERPAYAQPYDWSSAGNGGSAAAAVQATASSSPRASRSAVDAYA
jgi:flagellar hook-length control protein FliK